MKGMQSLIRKTTPSGYSYVREKNEDALSVIVRIFDQLIRNLIYFASK